jgi:2-dehydro-3-deoxy-D-arabinonate dehydratase
MSLDINYYRMKIFQTTAGIVVQHHDQYYLADETSWDTYVNRPHLHQKISEELSHLKSDPALADRVNSNLLPPIGSQEIWASGVTYMRSREARMEESKDAGGGDFYARVYEADRPELFFKAPAYRVVGSGDPVRIRRDSKWNVPEPELTLFICADGSIEGYTIGNDMSSRDIEGENPLYLPQAKSYNGSAAIGPCLYVPEGGIDPETMISIRIIRTGEIVFSGGISISRMRRKHSELVGYLFLEMTFPNGAYLMTGTGIIPPDDFTLQPDDEVQISIDEIGTLVNSVAR